MSRIFFSHRASDRESTKRLMEWLAEKGFECFFLDFDPVDGIPIGRDWEQELYDNLRICEALILVLSGEWLESRWCFFEFAHARATGKKIFPLKISPCEPAPPLSSLQLADL